MISIYLFDFILYKKLFWVLNKYNYHCDIKHTSGSIEPPTIELQNVFDFWIEILLWVSMNESGLASIPIKDPTLSLGLQADTLRWEGLISLALKTNN